MLDVSETKASISMLEKIVVNWATLPDTLFYRIIYKFFDERYSKMRFSETLKSEWEKRTRKYSKLLAIKQKYGKIPDRVKRLCKKSLCGYTRLLLTYLR